MRLAKMLDEKTNPMNQTQRADTNIVQNMPQEKGVLGQFGDMAQQKAMGSLLDYGASAAMGGTGGSAAAAGMMNPYVAGGILGAKMLGLFNEGGKVQNLAQGSMNPIASAVLNQAELQETENALISDYENIKRYLYGGGKVKYLQEGTDAPIPRPDIDASYALPDSLNENADILAMLNLPDFVKRAADSRSPSMIGEGGEPQAMQTVDYEAGGEQRLAPTIRVDQDMNQAYQMGANDAVRAAERTGDFARVPTERGYSAKEFSDLLSAYIGKLRKDSIDT